MGDMAQGLFQVNRKVRSRGVEEPISRELLRRPGAFAEVLQEMRLRSGMTIREIADVLGISTGSVHQYFYRQRGDLGSSTLRWFLRYADACGCEVSVSYPEGRKGRRAMMRHPSMEGRDAKTDKAGS
jgi:hypothetical protein